jgi:hypothetical protein
MISQQPAKGILIRCLDLKKYTRYIENRLLYLFELINITPPNPTIYPSGQQYMHDQETSYLVVFAWVSNKLKQMVRTRNHLVGGFSFSLLQGTI